MRNTHFVMPSLIISLFATTLNGQISFLPNSTLLQGSYGSPACVTDMNGDHLDDVVRLNGNMLTIDYQQPNGSFLHQEFITTGASGIWSICTGDLNNDGFNDVLLGDGNHVEFLIAVNGGTNYQQQYISDYIFSQRSTMYDIDTDGWLDAFVCHDVDQSHPFRNDGTGVMVEDQSLVPTGSSPEGGNYAAIWVDYDNDKDQDLYITKCRSGAPITDQQRINQMYRNDGGVFTEVAASIGLRDSAQSWSTVFEDFDNDGDFDCYIVNHTDQNRFLENDGAGNFTDIIGSTGIDANQLGAWEAQAGDFDNDGFIDIFSEVGGGIYRNNGNMTFTNIAIAPDEGGIGDLNNDGWLDYQLGGTVYLNTGGANHWVKIELEGILSAINGIGSRLEIYGSWGKQTRELRSGQGFSHMNSLQAHFGIGSATSIDSLVITWPSGVVTSIANPGIDQLHIIPEVSCVLPGFNINVVGATTFCPGSSVDLSAPNGYSSYQWSNGASTQTITVTDAGSYSVLGFNASNCAAMSDQILVTTIQENPAMISYLGDLSICDGDAVQLNATGSTLPLTWSTNVPGSSIQVDAAGDYWVVATGQCGTYNSDTVSVSVLPAGVDPVTTGDFLSGPGAGTVSAIGNNIWWYDAQNALDSIGSGNTWITPVVSQTTTFWAESNEVYPSAGQTGGRNADWVGGGLPAGGGFSSFNATKGFTIQSVVVNAPSAGVRNIELRDFLGNLLGSSQVNLVAGVSVINLGFHIDPGTGYSLRCVENNLFRHNTSTQYPYNIGNVGEITGSSNGPTYYYYFYDWTIQPDAKYCPSDRIWAVVDIVTGIEEHTGNAIPVNVYPNPSNGLVNIAFEEEVLVEMIELYDPAGKMILQEQPASVNGISQLNVSALVSGSYTLVLKTAGQTTTVALVIER